MISSFRTFKGLASWSSLLQRCIKKTYILDVFSCTRWGVKIIHQIVCLIHFSRSIAFWFCISYMINKLKNEKECYGFIIHDSFWSQGNSGVIFFFFFSPIRLQFRDFFLFLTPNRKLVYRLKGLITVPLKVRRCVEGKNRLLNM